MTERKTFLLRIDPQTYDALAAWADDELRSLNGQIEYVVRDALKKEAVKSHQTGLVSLKAWNSALQNGSARKR